MTTRRDLLRCSVAAAAALLAGCAPTSSERRSDRIRLWVAPNAAEEGFWKIAVARWNNEGRGLPVTFTTIPTAGNSEDTVLSALVAGTEPDLSTNIFAGFAVQLATLGQVENLAAMPNYAALVERRQMGTIMPGWTQDGRVSALPIYSSPTLLWWRADLLEANGLGAPPKTYDEVYAFCDRYAAGRRSRYGMQVIAGRSWQDRWFDFISFYYAASRGQPYLNGTRALYANAPGLQVATFINRMFREGWTAKDFDAEEPLVSGLAAGAVRGPWDVERFANIYPETLARITIGPMIAQAAGTGPTATFSDSKGMVIFKNSRVKRQAFDFIAWVLGDEAMNLLWLEQTGLSPARADLLENARFASYYKKSALNRAYAEHVASARPPALSEYTIDVQKIMSASLIEPLMTGQSAPAAALREAVGQTDRMLEGAGMIRRGGLSREAIVGLSLAGAYLAYTAVFWAYPFFWLAKLSVTQWRFFDEPTFTGARNLMRVMQDPQFLGSLWNVVRFLVFYLPLAFGGSLLVAFGLQHVGRGRAFVALCFLLSNVSSGVALSLVFLKIFSSTGPLNNALYDAVGIRIPWTNDPTLAMLAIALVVAWKFVGYYGLIIYSGLLTIPKELYDAARLDHAGPFTRLFRITLPMLNPQLMMVLTFAILVSFGLFTEPYLITGGGPADSTAVPQMIIYETAFRRLQPSHAATMSIVISLASYLLVVLARRLFEKKVVIA